MVADQTALILALPEDSAATLLQRARESGAGWVQILVPEGAGALADPAEAARLAAEGARAGIELVVISSDEPTLRAARAAGLLTMQVQGARVLPPAARTPAAPPQEDSRVTRRLEHEPRDAATTNLARDLSAGDAAFLDALDDLDAAPLRRDPDEAVDDMIALYRADQRVAADPTNPVNQSVADQLRAQSRASLDDDIAAALDSIDTEAIPPRRSPPIPPAPRVRPEDVELSPEELRRASQTGRRAAAAPPGAAPRPSAAPRPAAPRPQRPAPTPYPDEEPAEREERAGSPRWLIPVILSLLALLVAIAAILFLGGGLPGFLGSAVPGVTTIQVSLPVRPDTVEPVTGLAVPLVEPGASDGATAIQAALLSTDVAISAQGQVAEGTLAPVGSAGGLVTVLSLNTQAIPLPAGTEFIAVKPDGQEVPFVSTAEVVVPPATTADQGAQIVTTRGQVDVPVTARSAGSASNVDANTIRRMTIPGGTSFSVETGPLIVRHNALAGGSEQQVSVVKDADVQRALAGALTSLDDEARRQLQGLAAARQLTLEETTIAPRRADLEQLQGFEYSVEPPVGSTLDAANPVFTVTVQARYSGLATPAGRPLVGDPGGQLSPVFVEQLRRAGQLQAGDCRAPTITGWRWDGSTLFVDGQIGPDPACGQSLDPAAEQRVKDAVKGRTPAEAQAALEALVAEGVIGGYRIPAEIERFPSEDFLLSVSTQ